MSDHSRVLVPLESWAYQSPELWLNGREVDMGLFAESAIYYDRVIIQITNEPQFAQFVHWFIRQGKLADLIALLRDGTIQLYHYAFATGHIHIVERDTYVFANVQDQEAASRDVFLERVLKHPSLHKVTRPEHRARLRAALNERLIEVKAAHLGKEVVENARKDYLDPDRSTVLIQSLCDELYPLLGKRSPRQVTAQIEKIGEDEHRITWNVNLQELSSSLPGELTLALGVPGAAVALSNKLLWSAADLNCDLYLGSPLSRVSGDKLAESVHQLESRPLRKRSIMEALVSEVAYPDVRKLVNEGTLGLKDVLEIRKNAGKFRQWLQQEGGRDRNAIIAYHNEVAQESGWGKGLRKTLRLFGWLTTLLSGATGGVLAGPEASIAGGIAGAAAGKGLQFIADLAAKQEENWHPIVFGKWLEGRVVKQKAHC